MLKKYSKLLIVFIFLIALVVRCLYLPAKAVSFAYDQGRDAFVIQQLLGGHLKLQGPSVSGVPGLFHGVFYYYVIAPAYLIGHGNPVMVAYWLSFISSLGVFTVFYLAYLLTKKVTPALISALIFAFSFESSQYANLLTNASMGLWFVPIIYIGLYLWITEFKELAIRRWAPIITGLALGFSIQSEIALAYHFVPLLFWLITFRKNVSKKDMIVFISSLIIAVSSMILVELKFGFAGAGGMLYLLSGQDKIVQSMSLSNLIATFLNQTGKTFAYTIFPLNIVFGGLIGFFFIIFSFIKEWSVIKKNLLVWPVFLASYILCYSLVLPFGGSNMHHIMVGAGAGIAILTGISIWKYLGNNKFIFILTIVVILCANFFKILKDNINGQTIFPLQVDLVLSKETQVIDFTYQKAGGKPFSISTLTSPLFINTLWSYLYNWYGMSKYGYLPYWVGKDQIGSLGNNLEFASNNVTQHFFIMEPTFGIPDVWVNYAKGEQDSVSKLVEQQSFGEIIVQERVSK